MKTFEENHSQLIREFIVQACGEYLSFKYSNAESEHRFLGQVAVGAIFLSDADLFNRAVRLVKNGFDTQSFFDLGHLISFQTPVVSEDE
jgi:hypothetical protein